jgi:hypothetical protein
MISSETMRPESTPATLPEDLGAATPTTRDDKVDDIAVLSTRILLHNSLV